MGAIGSEVLSLYEYLQLYIVIVRIKNSRSSLLLKEFGLCLCYCLCFVVDGVGVREGGWSRGKSDLLK